MTGLTKASVLSKRDRVLAKTGGGSLVLLDIASGQYFSTNDVGAEVWQLADGNRSVAEIAAAVAGDYEVAVEVVEADVLDLAGNLVDSGLLLVDEGSIAR